MAELTEAKIAELKSANKGLHCLTVEGFGDFVFKRPSRQAYDMWRDGLNQPDAQRSTLARQLAQHCLVFPAWADLIGLLDAMPGLLAGEVLDACTKDTGLTERFEVKKL